ncbi:MAG: histidine kinase [Lachnospiraceae bacterium]|nr:histidine kinase [Lachnospiraceae bacterium]
MERRKFLIMGKKDRDSGLSIRQWGIAALLLGLIVILGILVCSTDYAVRKLEQESAAQYLSILDMRRASLDENLDNASAALVSYHISGAHMSDLLRAENRNEAYFAVANVSGDLKNQILMSTLSEVVFARKKTSLFDCSAITLSSTASFSSREKQDIHYFAKNMDMMQAGTDHSWEPRLIGGEWYFLYMISDGNMVIGQAIRAKTLVELYAMFLDEHSCIVLLSDEDSFMVEVPEAAAGLSLTNSRPGGASAQGNWMVVSTYSPNLRRPVFFVKEGLVSQEFENVIRILKYTAVAIFAVYIWIFSNFSRAVLRPLQYLEKGIEKIRDGNLEHRIVVPQNTPKEFFSVYKTLNEMTERIKVLKIDSYESELKRRQYEIQFLTLQIEPHFYLNSMKYVYALAQTKQYDQVQFIVLTLSGYFRYLTYDSGKKAALQKELEHVGYYLDIINAGAVNHVAVSITVDPDAAQVLVPKLLVQTFVENAVKHAAAGNRDLNVDIEVRTFGEEAEKFLRLRISDNGCGFSEEYISQTKKQGFVSRGNHVGLSNLYNRLKLMYPAGQSFMAISNNETGGATAEILLPALAGEQEEI